MSNKMFIDVSKIMDDIDEIVDPSDPKKLPETTLAVYLNKDVLGSVTSKMDEYKQEYKDSFGGVTNKVKRLFFSSKKQGLEKFKQKVGEYATNLIKLRKRVNAYSILGNNEYDNIRKGFVKKLDEKIQSLNKLLKVKPTKYEYESISSDDFSEGELDKIAVKQNVGKINSMLKDLGESLKTCKNNATSIVSANESFNKNYKLDYLATTSFGDDSKKLDEYIKKTAAKGRTDFKDGKASEDALKNAGELKPEVEKFIKEFETKLKGYGKQLAKMNLFVGDLDSCYVFDNNMGIKFANVKNGTVTKEQKKNSWYQQYFVDKDKDTKLPTVLEIIQGTVKLEMQYDHKNGGGSPYYMIVDGKGQNIVGGKWVGWRRINSESDDVKARQEVLGYIRKSLQEGEWSSELAECKDELLSEDSAEKIEENIKTRNDILSALKKNLESYAGRINKIVSDNESFNKNYKFDYLATKDFEKDNKQLNEYIDKIKAEEKTDLKNDKDKVSKALKGAEKLKADAEKFIKDFEPKLNGYEKQLNEMNNFAKSLDSCYVFDNNMSIKFANVKNGIVKGEDKTASGRDINHFADKDKNTKLPAVLDIVKDNGNLRQQFNHSDNGDRWRDWKGSYYVIIDSDGNNLVGGNTAGWWSVNNDYSNDDNARKEVIAYIQRSIREGRWSNTRGI